MQNKNKKRSGFSVAFRLIVLVRPLWLFMIFAILLGTAGFLCASFIPTLGVTAIFKVAKNYTISFLSTASVKSVFIMILTLAVLRGILHYAEQYCNHYIAFTNLAVIRDKVFQALRRLCPAKLECREKGNLINIISSDIELLEVFYAHTISPVAIAFLFCVIVCGFLAIIHPILAGVALSAFFVCGIFVPLVSAKKTRLYAEEIRNKSGKLSSFVLESLRGIHTVLQCGASENRLNQMKNQTEELLKTDEKIKKNSGTSMAAANSVILFFDALMIGTAAFLNLNGKISVDGAIISCVLLMSSFGPVTALANLGVTLQNTFAAGNRIIDILDEKPETEEIFGKTKLTKFDGVKINGLNFFYDDSKILTNINMDFTVNSIITVTGKSGSGKSTLLKLLMRFWKSKSGKINFENFGEINEINTSSLRKMESFVTQDTCLFHDSIESNLRIAKPDATIEEIHEACKKAQVHDFIKSLPEGYKTNVSELGDSLSSGEKQRISLARAFLHDSPLLLLDEPTSNLDSLNEALIIKSVKDFSAGKTVILVSHKELTNSIADKSYSVENGRNS